MADHHLAASPSCPEGLKPSPPEGFPAVFSQGEHSSTEWLSENLEDADPGLGDRVRALMEDTLVTWEELRARVDAIDWELLAGPQQLETSERRREAPGIGA